MKLGYGTSIKIKWFQNGQLIILQDGVLLKATIILEEFFLLNFPLTIHSFMSPEWGALETLPQATENNYGKNIVGNLKRVNLS